MISEFGEERALCCSSEPIIKDTSVIQSETNNLQQKINSLMQEVLTNTISTVLMCVQILFWHVQEKITGEMYHGESQTGVDCCWKD